MRSERLLKSFHVLHMLEDAAGKRIELPRGEMFMLFRIDALQRGRGMNCFECTPDMAERPVFVSDLRDERHISLPAVSQMLRSLERKGLISRSVLESDRRKIQVMTTSEGKAVLARGKRAMDEGVEAVLRRFGEQRAEQLVRLLEQLGQVIEEMQNEVNDA